MEPTAAMIRAHQIGAEIGPSYDALERACYAGRVPHAIIEDHVLLACLDAGCAGRPMLRWVRAWRYGDLPESGRSHDYRDNCQLPGVSVMEVYEAGALADETFVLLNGDRPRREVEGWLIHRRGSDGEHLLVGARYVA